MARKKNTEKSESAAKSKAASSKEVLKNGLVSIESDSKKELSDLKKELSDLKKSNIEMKSKLDSQKKESDGIDSLKESNKKLTSVYNNAKTRISKLEEVEAHSKVLEKEIEDLKSKSKHGGSETPVASSFNGVVEAHGDHISRFGSDQIGRA
jgi:DNA repair exonuclease SbcCD ATPase subunit